MEIDPATVFDDPGAVKRLVSPGALVALWRHLSEVEGFWDRLRALDVDLAAPIIAIGASQQT